MTVLLGFIGYAVVGRIIVFVWQKFPLEKIKILQPIEFLMDLHKCDLCSGVWIYTALAWIAGSGFWLGPIIGCVTSFVVWIFVKGLKAAFNPDIIHL